MQTAPRPQRGEHILALDTSTERMAVALHTPTQTLHTVSAGGAQASANVLPQVAALLRQAGLDHADLDFIAFGRGPGAFTGLRTACAVAQGLAFAHDKPVLPIDSLLIVAEDARQQQAHAPRTLDVAVAMDARMDEIYAAVYRCEQGVWQALQAPGLYSLPALAEAWAGLQIDLLAGSALTALTAFGPRLPLPPGAALVPEEQDRAAALLRLAVQAARAGGGVDAALALPLYLRDKVAQTTAEREAERETKRVATAAAAATAASPASAPAAGAP